MHPPLGHPKEHPFVRAQCRSKHEPHGVFVVGPRQLDVEHRAARFFELNRQAYQRGRIPFGTGALAVGQPRERLRWGGYLRGIHAGHGRRFLRPLSTGKKTQHKKGSGPSHAPNPSTARAKWAGKKKGAAGGPGGEPAYAAPPIGIARCGPTLGRLRKARMTEKRGARRTLHTA